MDRFASFREEIEDCSGREDLIVDAFAGGLILPKILAYQAAGPDAAGLEIKDNSDNNDKTLNDLLIIGGHA